MLHDTIKKLISILKEEDIDEIEVRRLLTTVRVVRRRAGRITQERRSGNELDVIEGKDEPVGLSQNPFEPSLDTETAASGSQTAVQFVPRKDTSNMEQIVSPMVGTFYRASGPQAEPFVYEGKRVEVGDVVCIIEAMKLMNEIESETSGIIRKVIAKDAKPVEYGQPLFLVESA